jgi:hypothetical protein
MRKLILILLVLSFACTKDIVEPTRRVNVGQSWLYYGNKPIIQKFVITSIKGDDVSFYYIEQGDTIKSFGTVDFFNNNPYFKLDK